MRKSIKFSYLYRDAGNYKSWGALVLKNPDGLTLLEIETRLKKSFEQEIFFIADQINVEEVFLFACNDLTGDDHCFHEFDSVELIEEKASDLLNRSITGFMEEVETESRKGWCAFNPMDRTYGKSAVN